MTLHVKQSGVWKQAQEVFVKTGGVWKSCLDVYVKTGGSWKSVLYEPGDAEYLTSGSYSLTVPAGVQTMTYNIWGAGGGGASTNSTGSFATTPGESLTIIVAANSTGNTTTEIKRGATSLASATGAVRSYPDPVYSVESTLSTNAFSFTGNVDSQLYIDFDFLGSNSYSGSGQSGTLESGAASAGCYYNEYSESNHGDLSASISLNEVSSYDSSKKQSVYLVSGSFRGEAGIQFRNYNNGSGRATIYTYDGGYSEGTASWTIGVRQGIGNTSGQGIVNLSW